MAAAEFFLPFRPAFNANGIVLPGAQLQFDATGTTTPQTVYSDAGLTTPLTNPVPANAAGRFPPIFLDDTLTYRVRLYDRLGEVIDEQDPYIPGFVGEGQPGGNVLAAGLFTNILSIPDGIASGTNLIQTTGRSVVGNAPGLYAEDALCDASLLADHPRFVAEDVNGRIFRALPVEGKVPVALGVAASDTDGGAAAAIAAAKYAEAIGVTHIKLTPGDVWTLTSSGEYASESAFNGDWLSFRPGIVLDANGAILRGADSILGTPVTLRGLDYRGVFLADRNLVTAAHAAGANVITITNASIVPVGSWVLFRFGDVPYDTPETYQHGLARVTARNTGANTITLDRYMPREFSGADLAAAVHNKHVSVVEPLIGINFGDLIFDEDHSGGYAGIEHGVVVKQAINCRFGTVGGRGLHVGMFIAQYSYNLQIDKLYNRGSRATSADTGNGSRFAEAHARVDHHVTHDLDRAATVLEGACVVHYGTFEDDHNGYASRKLFILNGRSYASVDRVFMTGLGGQALVDAQDNSHFAARHLHVRTSAMPVSCGAFCREVTDSLVLEIGDGAKEEYRASTAFWHTVRVELRDNQADFFDFAPKNHLVCAAEVFTSSGVGAGEVNDLTLIRTGGGAGTTQNMVSSVVAGQTHRAEFVIGSNEFNRSDRDKPLQLYVGTDAAAGLAGEFVIVRVLLVPNGAAADGATMTDAQANRFVAVNTVRIDGSAYADNAAALAAGLAVNELYKTTTGEVRVVV